MAAVIKSGNEIKLGADPEFIILPEDGTSGPCAIYESWRGDAGNFSQDNGSRSTGELRPSPGSPREITENIRTLIRRIRNAYPRHKLVVGGGNDFQKYIGGHIHFNIWNGPGTNTPPPNMVKALDFFLGRNLKSMNGGNRYNNSNNYGADGDTRSKDHGFEYRTAPSFIVCPIFTEAVFSIAFRIAELALEDSSVLNVSDFERATVNDYDVLIPAGSPFENYYRTQISNFKDYVFGGFTLSIDDAFDRWLSPIPFEFKPGQAPTNIRATRAEIARQLRQSQIDAEARATRVREETALRLSQAIIGHACAATPIRCRIQHTTNNSGATTELTTHSVIPEIRIHQGYHWESRLSLCKPPSPRQPWRNRAIRFDQNVVYISNELKGKFKIPRTIGFKVKYVNIFGAQNTQIRAIVTSRTDLTVADIVTKILHSTKREARLITA